MLKIGFPTLTEFSRFFLTSQLFVPCFNLILGLFEIENQLIGGARLSVFESPCVASLLTDQGGADWTPCPRAVKTHRARQRHCPKPPPSPSKGKSVHCRLSCAVGRSSPRHRVLIVAAASLLPFSPQAETG
jgi:hypothetical protein